jgi:hypothetical protein
LFKLGHRIDRRFPLMNRRFIRCFWLRYFSSTIHPAHLETGLSDHPTVSILFGLLRSVPSAPTLASWVPSVHPTVAFPCFLASLTCFFASLIVVASMGPRYVYKDMLDNEVSPITCVSINHQNQLEHMANGAMFAIVLLHHDSIPKPVRLKLCHHQYF